MMMMMMAVFQEYLAAFDRSNGSCLDALTSCIVHPHYSHCEDVVANIPEEVVVV